MDQVARTAADAGRGLRTGLGDPSAPATRSEVLGAPIDALDLPSTVRRCLELIEDGGGRQVSVNAAKVVLMARDPRLARFVRESEVVSADGQSIVWAARLLGSPVPARVAGIDLMMELLAEAERRDLSVFVLGARQEVLDEALGRIRASHPGLSVQGSHGYFTPQQGPEVARRIRDAGTDLLFVAMPSPRKEIWLDENLDELGVCFAMGVGGAVDVIAGRRARAPRWIQRLGLEWLYRLSQDPAGMWRRYLVGNLRFGALLARALLARPRQGARG
jgi:N-acetylglucosaminyldiphosphoundecaprenol N-acetyl-beta-D-mannosaminyltransferase